MEITSKIYLSLFDCTLWSGVAESTTEYCKKGDLLGVKGRIQSRVIEKENEKKNWVTEVVAERVTFLSNKKVEEMRNQTDQQ